MIIKFGRKSKLNLCKNLDYRLVTLAVLVSMDDRNPCDWTVFETERTIEQQKENVAKGVSKTMNSKHIPDENGIVRAMDIVPYVKLSRKNKEGKVEYYWANSWIETKEWRELMELFREYAERLFPEQIELFIFKHAWDWPHIQIADSARIK